MLVTRQVVILAFFPANDEFVVWCRAKVAADFEKHDVIKLVVTFTTRLPEISQFTGIGFVCQEAAASGRLRIFLDAEGLGQLDLRGAVTSMKAE